MSIIPIKLIKTGGRLIRHIRYYYMLRYFNFQRASKTTYFNAPPKFDDFFVDN